MYYHEITRDSQDPWSVEEMQVAIEPEEDELVKARNP